MAAASPLLRDVATLIVETGMRPEEVFTIRKENVHLQPPYLFIPNGKTRFARRNIQLTDASVNILRQRLAESETVAAACAKQENARVSPNIAAFDLAHRQGPPWSGT